MLFSIFFVFLWICVLYSPSLKIHLSPGKETSVWRSKLPPLFACAPWVLTMGGRRMACWWATSRETWTRPANVDWESIAGCCLGNGGGGLGRWGERKYSGCFVTKQQSELRSTDRSFRWSDALWLMSQAIFETQHSLVAMTTRSDAFQSWWGRQNEDGRIWSAAALGWISTKTLYVCM